MSVRLLLTSLLLGFVVSSCYVEEPYPERYEGPPGPQGPQGPQGPEGAAGESGFVFEFDAVSFTAPDYEVFLSYSDDFEVLESDVALVYLLWDVQTDSNGDPLEVWRQIPQTVLTPDGLLQYNFDFSMVDVHLFLDAEFDLNTLTAQDTDDWVVRAVVVPGDFWTSGRNSVDHSDYDAVIEHYGLPQLPAHDSVKSRRE